MKNIKYILYVLIVMVFMSCEDFMDIHKDYVKNGEIVYSPRVDSASFLAGNKRVKALLWLYNSPNVNIIKMYWNNKKDSSILSVTPTSGRDLYEQIIDLNEEKTYSFEIVTIDKWGNKSLTDSYNVNVYGENFQASISNRVLKSASMSSNGTDAQIEWFGADQKLEAVEIEYLGSDNTIKTKISPANELITVIPNINKDEPKYRYRSIYKPEPTAIDKFYTNWSEYKIIPALINKSTWSVVAWSSYPTPYGTAYGPSNIIDGNNSTFWHNNWSSSQGQTLPHYLVVDMGVNVEVFSVIIVRRTNFAHTKTVQVKVSESQDYSNVAAAGSVLFPTSASDYTRTLTLVKPQIGRYLILLLPDSYSTADNAASIAEVSVIGIKK